MTCALCGNDEGDNWIDFKGQKICVDCFDLLCQVLCDRDWDEEKTGITLVGQIWENM